MRKIINNLDIFGLDQKSSKVYLFLLENKDLPAYKISKETNIPRTTVYKILDNLEKQNIVSSWNKNNVKHYSAENPERLKEIINNRTKALEEIFGDLKDLYKNDKNYPKTKVLTGKDGIKTAFNHIYETMVDQKIKRVYVFSEPQLTEALPKFFVKWREKKNKKTNAFTQMIVPSGVSKMKNYQSDNYRETREMPSSFPFDGSIDIIGDNIYFFSFKEKEVYSIIIESSIVAKFYTDMFKYIWSTLENPTA
jgi:sugar-specific transcriptional regulator TrmB